MSKAGDSILRGAREALAYARGEGDGFAVHIPDDMDVRAIRERTGLSQAKFSASFGFAIGALRNWEQGRRQPDVAARAFLMVIEHEPEAVRRALTAEPTERPARLVRAKGKSVVAKPKKDKPKTKIAARRRRARAAHSGAQEALRA